MYLTPPSIDPSPTRCEGSPQPARDQLADLKSEIEHAAHLLPSQGPIESFVHHNTLHMLEHLPFHDAVKEGAAIFGCEPYLSESQYRQHLQSGRIALADLEDELRDAFGGQDIWIAEGLTTTHQIRSAMLRYPLQFAPSVELRWFVAETDALVRFRADTPEACRREIIEQTRHWVMRDLRPGSVNGNGGHSANRQIRDSLASLFAHYNESAIEHWSSATWEAFTLQVLWRVCRHGAHAVHPASKSHSQPVRHRDLLLEVTGNDSDHLVNDFLIRMCAAFLDQGFSREPMPGRAQGFFHAVCLIYGSRQARLARWAHGLAGELERLRRERVSPLESIDQSLRILGVQAEERERYLAGSLLALRGWAGMLWRMETDHCFSQRAIPPGTLIEYLAIRLILERLACEYLAKRELSFAGPLAHLREELRKHTISPPKIGLEIRAFQLFHLAQVCGWTPENLARLSKPRWGELIGEIESFTEIERRRVLHQAYERRYRIGLLDAVAVAASHHRPRQQRPRCQAVFCIDDREESFRRHLEEVAPDIETLSVAGFYAVAMHYRGAADAHYMPLSPVMIKPQHFVEEEVPHALQDTHRRRAGNRRALGVAQHRWHMGSRTMLGGVIAGLLGSLASIPLVMRVLFPRATARIHRLAGSVIQPPSSTRLVLQRTCDPPGPEPGHQGFTLDEMSTIVQRVLLDIGLTSGFARLVILHGHGSSSMNNPHESAYNCGACSGGRGGPNARAFAQMANNPEVRNRLDAASLTIPEDTVFLAAYHNTCDDSITWYDLDSLPATHRGDFERARQAIDQARQRNAHERCRRFESVSLLITPEEALRHVESRAADLSEARPEYNHATNAATIVGRRWRTRGLFLDRRVFLNSYDPSIDDAQHTILARILQAAIPVCAGISLEYYFSCVDPEGWGCGSKLPHNVTGLLGVMSGAASDLRPGLSAQMTEIHEPLRQLFVIETTPAAMLSIMDRNPVIDRLVRGHWVQLATLDPESSQLHLYTESGFEPYHPTTKHLPTVSSSAQWYRGWRGDLGFAWVDHSGSHASSGSAI